VVSHTIMLTARLLRSSCGTSSYPVPVYVLVYQSTSLPVYQSIIAGARRTNDRCHVDTKHTDGFLLETGSLLLLLLLLLLLRLLLEKPGQVYVVESLAQIGRDWDWGLEPERQERWRLDQWLLAPACVLAEDNNDNDTAVLWIITIPLLLLSTD
jgi:hypothetical protein